MVSWWYSEESRNQDSRDRDGSLPRSKRDNRKNNNSIRSMMKIRGREKEPFTGDNDPPRRIGRSYIHEPVISRVKKQANTATTSLIPAQKTMNQIYNVMLCSDKTTEAWQNILNDDYCDCPDGSDEPDTSACSNILVNKSTFQCADGFNFIFTSRVNDGVIDCFDGSDEEISST